MLSSANRVYFGDFIFFVDENVYKPAEDSFLFAENIEIKAGESGLDMGTGCGILGILAAEKARKVVAVDVNPYAVLCAKENAALNDVRGNIAFVRGNLFTCLSGEAMFDIIFFNAPYLPTDQGKVGSWLELAWSGGTTGRQIIDRFIAEAPAHLNRDGRILLMQSTLANVDETMHKFALRNMHAEVLVELALPFFESVVLIEARL